MKVRVFDRHGQLVGPVESPRVSRPDEEWRAQLTKAQYEVARGKGTERPFCGTLLDNKQEGAYSCVCCGLPLFTSQSKFESGTGWPSFYEAMDPDAVELVSDRSLFMTRTEARCARCGAHLGHLFDDGPAPTGQRFCMNSASLHLDRDAAVEDDEAQEA